MDPTSVKSLFDIIFPGNFWTFAFIFGEIILTFFCSLLIAMIVTRRQGLDPATKITSLERYPMISVIFTLKGVHEDTETILKSKLKIKYPGKIEFIAVVESEEDPAYQLANDIFNNTTFEDETQRSTLVTVSGLTWHNSQKIHNILQGISMCSQESEYVLLTDDDVFLYPGIIEDLLYPLQKNPEKILLSGGYDYPVPPIGSTIHNYATIFYRMINYCSYITPTPILVWGGCQFGPLWVFRQNLSHIVDVYIDGGYSDDNLISMMVQENGYLCYQPRRAIFPTECPKDRSFHDFWDYICRQYFPLTLYATSFAKSMGYSLAFLICTSVWLMGVWGSIAPFAGIFAIFSHSPWCLKKTVSVAGIVVWFFVLLLMNAVMQTMLKVSNSLNESKKIYFHCNFLKLFIGSIEMIFLMPFSVIKVLFSNSIVWSGIRYYRQNGKIVAVERVIDGKVVTKPATDSIARVRSLENYKVFQNLALPTLDEINNLETMKNVPCEALP